MDSKVCIIIFRTHSTLSFGFSYYFLSFYLTFSKTSTLGESQICQGPTMRSQQPITTRLSEIVDLGNLEFEAAHLPSRIKVAGITGLSLPAWVA